MRQGDPTKRRLYLANGTSLELPDSLTDEDIQYLRDRFPDKVLSDPTLPGAVAEAGKRLFTGIGGTASIAGKGIAALLPGDIGGEDVADAATDWFRSHEDARYDDSTIAGTGGALGSTIPFLAAGAALGPVGFASLGGLSGAGDQATRMDMAEEEGKDVSDFDRVMSLLGGTAVGLSEAVAPRGILKLVPGAVQAGARSALKKASQNWATSAISSGIKEATQEVIAGVAQSTISRLYDADAEIAPDWREGLLGFNAGAILNLAVRAGSTAYGRRSGAVVILGEDEARNAVIAAANYGPDIAEIRRVQEEDGGEINPSSHIRPLQYIQEEDGTYSVVERGEQVDFMEQRPEGSVLARGLVTEEEASAAMNEMNDAMLNRSVLGGVLMKLDNQGLGEDPWAIQLGMLVSHPNFTNVSVRSMNAYLQGNEEIGGGVDPYTGERVSGGSPIDPRSILQLAGAPKDGEYVGVINEKLNRHLETVGEFATMRQAREILGDDFSGFQSLYSDLAMTQAALINRDLKASMKKNGMPALRANGSHMASMKFYEDIQSVSQALLEGRMPETVSVTTKDIYDMMQARGYNVNKKLDNPEFMYIAKSLTGTDSPFSTPQDRVMLASRLALIPELRGTPAAGQRIPDLAPPRYSPTDYANLVKVMESEGSMSVNDLRSALSMENVPFKQLERHAVQAGVIKKKPGSKTYKYVEPQEAAVVQGFDEGVEAINEMNAMDGVSTRMVETSLKRVRAMQAEKQNRPIEEVNEEYGSAQESAEVIVETADRLRVASEYVAKLTSDLGMNIRNGADVAVFEQDAFDSILKAAGRYVADRNVAAAFIDNVHGPARIILNASAADPDGTMTGQELAKALEPTTYYEHIRWLRNYDFFWETEWDTLKRFVRKSTVSPAYNGEVGTEAARRGQSWYELAAEQMGVKIGTNTVTDEAVAETAIAMAFEAHIQKQLEKSVERSTAGGMLNKASGVLGSLLDIGSRAKLGPALSIFSQIEKGRLQQRRAGKSIINPEGEVRSLLMTERGLVGVEKARYEDVVTESKKAEIERESKPIPPPLSKDVQIEIAEKTQKEVDEALAVGMVPRVNPNASIEARNVYYNWKDPRTGVLGDQIRFKTSPIVRGTHSAPIPKRLDTKKSPIGYDPSQEPRSLYEIAQDALEDPSTLDNVKEFIDHWTTNFREEIIDQRYQNEELSKRARAAKLKEGEHEDNLRAGWSSIFMVRMLDKSTAVMDANMRRGVPVYKDGYYTHETIVVDGKEYAGLYEAFYGLKGKDGLYYDSVADLYLTAKRVKYQIENGLIDKFPGDMDMEYVNEVISEIEKNPGYDPVLTFSKVYREYNNRMVDFMVSTNQISADKAVEFKGSEYLPWDNDSKYQKFLKARSRKKSRASRTTRAELELEGTKKPLNKDMITRIIRSVENVTRDGMTNEAYRKTARDLLITEEGKKVPKSSAASISFMENGERKFVEAEDPAIVAATMASGSDVFEGNLKSMAIQPARWLREAVTRMPAFWLIRNPFRDTISTWFTSGSDFVPFKDTIKNFNRNSLERAQSLGIAMMPDFINDESKYAADVIRQIELWSGESKTIGESIAHPFAKVWDLLGEMSMMSDSATRMAVHDDIFEKTGNEAEAIYQAGEIINYSRRGRWPVMRIANAVIPFLNAGVQGTDLLYRSLIKDDYTAHPDINTPGKIRERALKRGLFIAGVTAAYYAYASDKEWYKNAGDEVKDDNWIFQMPWGGMVHIPIPFEVGVLFKTFPEQFLRAMDETGYDFSDARSGAVRSIRQTMRIDPTPQVLGPLLDVMNNRDGFSGREIVPSYMKEGMRALDQRDLNTNEAASLIASMISPLSEEMGNPKKIEYLINGYGGPMAVWAMMVVDKIARMDAVRRSVDSLPGVELQSIPLMSSDGTIFDNLLSGSAAGTRLDMMNPRMIPGVGGVIRKGGGGYQEQFYELRTEIDRAVASVNKARREGRIDDMRTNRARNSALYNVRGRVRALDRYMTNWRKRRDRVYMDGSLSPKTKRDRIRVLEEERDVRLAVVPLLVEASRGQRQ